MTRGAARRGRIAALFAAGSLGVAVVLLVSSAPATSAVTATATTETTAPGSTLPSITTTSSSTTSVVDTSTSTTEPTTTTSRVVTTTTRPRSQTTATTEPATTTSVALLIPGDGTKGAESTTTTIETATKVSADGPSDGVLIGTVIAGLLVVAIAVGVLTWRYWIATRPPLLDPEGSATSTG